MSPSQRGSVMLAALVVVTVTAAVSAALSTLAHTELVLARNREAAAQAQAAADGCLAAVVAGLPAGWAFDGALAGPDGAAGTADDGQVPAPVGCSATLVPAPGPATPPRVLADVTAAAGPGRRAVRGVVARAPSPDPPGLLWLADATSLGPVAGTLTLDGVDPGRPEMPAIAAPGDPTVADAWLAAQGAHVVTSTAPVHAPPPPIAELAARMASAGAASTGTLVASGPPPLARSWRPGDLAVTGTARGQGVLLVEGRLDIAGTFEFNGVVVASGGIRVAAGARLDVRGAVWLGPGATLVVDGDAAVRADGDAMAAADGLLPLPRRARLAGLRDPP